jgi:hypothetical protein
MRLARLEPHQSASSACTGLGVGYRTSWRSLIGRQMRSGLSPWTAGTWRLLPEASCPAVSGRSSTAGTCLTHGCSDYPLPRLLLWIPSSGSCWRCVRLSHDHTNCTMSSVTDIVDCNDATLSSPYTGDVLLVQGYYVLVEIVHKSNDHD